MNLLSLAARNLLRRKGRTMLTVMGVAIAVSVLFSLLAFNAGYEKEIGREMSSLGVHMLAVPKGCPYEAASLIIHGGVIPKYLSEDDLSRVRSLDGVDIATPMLLHQFIKEKKPHIVYGIIMNDSLRLKPWWKVEGRLFLDNESHVMVVGRSIAERENLTVGQVLPFGPKKENFTITGILERTGDQDDEFHFVPLSEAQRVFSKGGRITAIAVRVKDLSTIARVSDEMEQIPDIQVVTMTQIMGTIMNLAASARALLLSVIAVAVIISAFGILNTLLMSINERSREFGMMKAIGASGLDIARLVMAETLFITTSGGALGVTVSILGAGLIESSVKSMLPYSPAGPLVSIDPTLVASSMGFSIGLGLICGLYPAIRSSRLSPMEAIRGGMD